MRTFANPPFTILQLLSSYTINGHESELAMETFHREFNKLAMVRLDDHIPLLFSEAFPLDHDDIYQFVD